MTTNPLHNDINEPCDYYKIYTHPFFQEPYTIYHKLVDNNIIITDEIIVALSIKTVSPFVIYGTYCNMYSLIAKNPHWINNEIIYDFNYYSPSNTYIDYIGLRCILDLFEKTERIEQRKHCVQLWNHYIDKICFSNRVEKCFPLTNNNEHVARFIDVCNKLQDGTYCI
jgi:hypothetical protein